MSYATYLRIEGIEGDCADGAHKGWMEVQSFSQSVVAHEGRGAGPAHQDFNICKMTDRSSPHIAQAVCGGRHFKEAVLELCTTGGTRPRFMEIRFTDVTLSHYSISGGHSSDLAPYENLNLKFGRVEWRYFPNAFVPGREKEAQPILATWDPREAGASAAE